MCIRDRFGILFTPYFNPFHAVSDDDIPSEDGDHHQRNSDKFNSDIAEWAIRFDVNHSTLNGLMQILRCHVSEDLPCDARTVLKTKRTVAVARKSGGEYTYIGKRQAISKQPINFDTTKISLIVNIDGLPLFKSSDLQVWPILGKLETGNPVSYTHLTLPTIYSV